MVGQLCRSHWLGRSGILRREMSGFAIGSQMQSKLVKCFAFYPPLFVSCLSDKLSSHCGTQVFQLEFQQQQLERLMETKTYICQQSVGRYVDNRWYMPNIMPHNVSLLNKMDTCAMNSKTCHTINSMECHASVHVGQVMWHVHAREKTGPNKNEKINYVPRC